MPGGVRLSQGQKKALDGDSGFPGLQSVKIGSINLIHRCVSTLAHPIVPGVNGTLSWF